MPRRKIHVDFREMPAYTRPEEFRERRSRSERGSPVRYGSLEPNDEWELDNAELYGFMFEDVGDR
jgi:hypothetical protein